MESTKSDKAIERLQSAVTNLDSQVAWLASAVAELRIAAEGREVSTEQFERIQQVWNGPDLNTKGAE